MNRDAFYKALRPYLGAFDQNQVDGFERILDEAERRRTPLFDLAYMLPTAWWETGKTMQPVREAFYLGSKAEAWRKRNLRYYPFYGRGLVQLTWDYNYKKASDKLGVDFVKNPDRVMEWQYAVPILFDGMEAGWFTAKKLDDYIDDIDEDDAEDLREFVNARRIINGTDKASTIGSLALRFEQALKASDYGAPPDVPVPEPIPVEPKPTNTGAAVGAGVVVAGAVAATFWERIWAFISNLF